MWKPPTDVYLAKKARSWGLIIEPPRDSPHGAAADNAGQTAVDKDATAEQSVVAAFAGQAWKRERGVVRGRASGRRPLTFLVPEDENPNSRRSILAPNVGVKAIRMCVVVEFYSRGRTENPSYKEISLVKTSLF